MQVGRWEEERDGPRWHSSSFGWLWSQPSLPKRRHTLVPLPYPQLYGLPIACLSSSRTKHRRIVHRPVQPCLSTTRTSKYICPSLPHPHTSRCSPRNQSQGRVCALGQTKAYTRPTTIPTRRQDEPGQPPCCQYQSRDECRDTGGHTGIAVCGAVLVQKCTRVLGKGMG